MNLSSLVEAKRRFEREVLPRAPLGLAAFRKSVASGEQLGWENFAGIGVGWKYSAGRRTNILGIVMYVVRKLPAEQVRIPIPRIWEGYATDVQELGEVIPFRTTRRRPAPGGVSIGHYQITAGTLGSVLLYEESPLVLSNNHVLANSNNAAFGDPILQPGPYDGGQNPRDIIAELERYVPIRFGELNTADAALARPVDRAIVSHDVLGIGTPTGLEDPSLNQEVIKSGRTTGVTRGSIDDIDVTIDVDYGDGLVARFTDQVKITGIAVRFSEPGDSGSVVLDLQHRICALLFAGSRFQNATFATPIQLVVDALA